MKRSIVAIAVFFVAFITTYFVICFAVPGMRIKLDAAPVAYFFASITHMVFFKALISFVIALIAGLIPIIIMRKK